MSGLEKTSEEDPTEIFEILAKLGEGSYGSVYKALDKRDGKIVAIKVLEVENEDNENMRREINILKECYSPFIVAYKGTYQKDNQVWIVMEYCVAGSICDLMAICEKTLTEEQIAIVLRMALHGLAYLHNAKKIHRDIKSGNILLNHEGDCKLADFGVSAELTSTLAKRKTVIGTPYWMAPEVLQSAEYNGKADIWSLAITAFELAVGEPPHSNVHPMRAIFLIPTSDPPTLPNPEKWSEDFKDFMRVCLQKNPANRPTAEELLKTHPFILKSKGKQVIAKLVEECIAEIDEYREQEAQQAAEREGTGTMISTGTIHRGNNNQKKKGGSDSTMASKDGESFGTMVYNREAKKGGDAGSWETGTMVSKQGENGMFYYRTGMKLEINKDANLDELKNALESLNAAYEREVQALEAFYQERRQQLSELIGQKER